jgi:hypothetical protein
MGRTESDKAQEELAVFSRFVQLHQLQIVDGSISKEEPPYPDIRCEVVGEGIVGFELAEACAPEFKAAVTRALKGGPAEAVYGGDVSEATMRKKLAKRYPRDYPVELVLYAGDTALPDDALEPTLRSLVQDSRGQFRKVWLLGDELLEL